MKVSHGSIWNRLQPSGWLCPNWFWWDLNLISSTNWFPSVFWHCWFSHVACKNRLRNDL